MSGNENFRINTFLVTADKTVAELKKCHNAYQELVGFFGFLAKPPEFSTQQIL
jgi:hypothetical protein